MEEHKILVVEDEQTLRRLLEYRLSKQYRVRTASNGEEALALIKQEYPDLIISDTTMPKMDGWEFNQALQKNIRTRVIPFIFLTAQGEDKDVLRGRRSGADDYITKPFDIDQLLIRISRLIERVDFFRGEIIDKEPTEPLRLFLCHAKEDKDSVFELYKRLAKSGTQPWLDQKNILPGQKWELEIRKALRESHIVIVCLSKQSTGKRGYIQKEIKEALDIAEHEPEGAIFIIPLRLEDCTVPDRLSQTQWVDLFTTDGYTMLLEALSVRAAALSLKPPENT